MSSDSSDSSDHEEQVDDVTEEERLKIRSELSTMSFEELQKLKEEIGSKMYNKTLHGDSSKKQVKKQFTRVNKNRPRERSSKIKPRFNKKLPNIPQPQQPLRKDPRFDEKCGTFDKGQFRSNYRFIEELKTNERKQLAAEYAETKDENRKKQIKLLMGRIDNQLRESKKLDKLEEKQRKEAELHQQQREQGEKPIYKKKSEKKIEDLVAKYEELKKNNKVQKHIERRSRKLLGKERKKLDSVK